MAIELSDSVLIQILRQHLTYGLPVIKENINIEHIIDLITSRLSDTDKGTLLEILLSQEEYHTINQGAMVWIKMGKYDEPGTYGCMQTLKDIGLIKDNYILGKIVDSDNYSNDYDKWHYKFKVEMLIHKDGNFNKTVLTYDRQQIKVIAEDNLDYAMKQVYLDKISEVETG